VKQKNEKTEGEGKVVGGPAQPKLPPGYIPDSPLKAKEGSTTAEGTTES